METTMKSPRRVGAALAVIATVLVAWLPVDSPVWVAVSIGTGLIALGVFLLAAVRMPSQARRVWWLLWLYAALTVAGNVVYDVVQYHLGIDPFPSWADPLYLAAYVPQVMALVILMRQRQRVWDRQTWIDSAIITLAAVTVAGAFVLLPMMSQSESSGVSAVVSLAYPILDLVVLAILIRLTVGGGRPMTSLLLLTASVAVTLVADLVYNGLAIEGVVDDAPGWLEALFTAGLLLMVFAATDPLASAIGHPSPRQDAVMSRPRTLALGVGALTAPVLLAIGTRDDSTPEVFFLAVASIAVNVLVIWRILLLISTVQRQADRLALLSRTDALTGLPNRRSWDFELLRAVEAARASGQPLTISVADIDHFKDYNDSFGHVAGDIALVECARRWRKSLDPAVFLARYGGEEFALILPGGWSDSAADTLDAMRRATPAPLTLSVGYACQEDEPIEATVARADLALYEAKAAGRDQVSGKV
jgi:diguanylate cyclase (GGDEF)-like protein